MKMCFLITTALLLLIWNFPVFGQADRKHIREGNRYFDKKEYDKSEIAYRKALEKEENSFKALFNLGDALYKQDKYEDAAGEFDGLSRTGKDRISTASSYHNMGNSLLKANRIEESIEAYKNALRHNPGDLETKFNLAYAQDMLQKQQQQQQDQENKDQEGQQDQQEKKEDQQNQQQKEDQESGQQENKQDQQQQQQQQPQQISKEDARRILEALANDETLLQEKLQKAEARKQRVKTLKNW